jgi:methionyl-tRNA formyltransferase
MPSKIRAMFGHNLVVHESDLPRGKGWPPMTWQILEGKDKIPVSLLEAVEKVDSGDIYIQECIEFAGHELVEELRQKQAKTNVDLCKKFVDGYRKNVMHGHRQKGLESFYRRRTPADSRVDPDKTIREQFNLFRVVDNKR